MKKVFVSHSTKFDFQKELYEPLKHAGLNFEFIFPHEGEVQNTKDLIKNSDLVLAEISSPSTGQGIELGWAEAFNIPIVCVYKSGAKISDSLKYVSDKFFEYHAPEELIRILQTNLK